jgi:hypothetical protein
MPLLYIRTGETPPHAPAGYTNLRFIIEKIRYIKQGLNTQTTLVVYVAKNSPVWVDATIAITRKEILY